MIANPSHETTFTQTSELEFVMSRVFDAPRELVYQACTEPRHLAHWWGPAALALAECESDLRPGGAWRMVQRDADGNEAAFHGIYREVEPPARVVMTQIYDPFPQSEMLVSIAFQDLGDGRTRLVDTMRFDSVETRDAVLASGMEVGARESYDRLADLVDTLQRGLLFERIFDAPRELVFDVWTNPKHIAQWWGPEGFTNTVDEMDVRPGGVWRFTMHSPDGVDYPNRIEFVEVVRPERLVYDHTGDADESSFRGVVTFLPAEHGKTRLIMRSLFPSADVRAYAKREFHAEEGGNQTLDRLGAYLAGLRSN